LRDADMGKGRELLTAMLSVFSSEIWASLQETMALSEGESRVGKNKGRKAEKAARRLYIVGIHLRILEFGEFVDLCL
jgi:hypothetical protein